VSRWNGYDGKPYKFGFLDFLIEEKITVNVDENASFSASLNLSEFSYSNVDPENLMLFAVVFNAEASQGYANPPDQNPFDAYYADGVDATEVIQGGNLPPQVGITFPEQGKMYFGKRILFSRLYQNRLLSNTWLFGKKTITAYAEDDVGIEKVEFYLDGELFATVEEAPYEWTGRTVTKKFIRFPWRHTITVQAYDVEGKTSEASIDVRARL
jgi:hypothetical protein